jgi:hypothetical protein
MFLVADYAEYLDEVREQVCGRCPQRDPDRYPWPGSENYGLELRLSELVETTRDATELEGLDSALPARLRGVVQSVHERCREGEAVPREKLQDYRNFPRPVLLDDMGGKPGNHLLPPA